MFPLPEIQAEFKKFVLVRLHVEANNQYEIQERLIKVATLPSYVILKPGTEEVAEFIGYPQNPGSRVQEFKEFLSRNSAQFAKN